MSYLKPLQNIAVCLSANAHWDFKPPFWLLSFWALTLADSSHCTPESCRAGFFPLLLSHGFLWCTHLSSSSAQTTGEKTCFYLIFLVIWFSLVIKNTMGAVGFDPIPGLPFLLPWLKGTRMTCAFPGSWGGLGAPGWHFSWGHSSGYSLLPLCKTAKKFCPNHHFNCNFLFWLSIACKLVAEDVCMWSWSSKLARFGSLFSSKDGLVYKDGWFI